MAQKSGGDGWLWTIALIGGAAILYAYSTTGRGSDNSPLIPDALEDPIDRVVAALIRAFGPKWVNWGLDALQSHIQRTMPEVAWLVNAVHWVEQASNHTPMSGPAKKQAAIKVARGTLFAGARG